MRVVFVAQGSVESASPRAFRLLRNFARLDERIRAEAAFECVSLPAPSGPTAERDLAELAARILSRQPDILGLSLYCWTSRELLAIARYVKLWRPGTAIVVGGPELSGESIALMTRHPEVDFAIEGDGELSFRALLSTLLVAGSDGSAAAPCGGLSQALPLDSAGRLADVPFLTYRIRGQPVRSRNQERITSLDEIPSAIIGTSREEVLAHFSDGRSAVILETMRGCPIRCTYCQYPKTNDGRLRYFSVDRVLDELRYVTDFAVDEIYFADGVFATQPDRAVAFLDYFLEETAEVKIHAEVKLDGLSAAVLERCRALLATGRLRLGVGVQTINRGSAKRLAAFRPRRGRRCWSAFGAWYWTGKRTFSPTRCIPWSWPSRAA